MESVSSWVGGELLLHAPCFNLSGRTSGGESILQALFCHLSSFDCWGVSSARLVPESVEKWLGSFSYTPRTLIRLVIRQERSLSYMPGAVIFLVVKRVGSFSYTPRVSSFVGREISLTRPVLVSVLG